MPDQDDSKPPFPYLTEEDLGRTFRPFAESFETSPPEREAHIEAEADRDPLTRAMLIQVQLLGDVEKLQEYIDKLQERLKLAEAQASATDGVETPPPPAPPHSAPSNKKPLLSGAQLAVLGFGLLAISNVSAWLEIRKLKAGPDVSVVSVRQMTQDYVNQISSQPITPQEAMARTQVFTAAAQQEVEHVGAGHGLVLARECVLTGEKNDLTPEVQKSVTAKLAALTGGLSQVAGPVSPQVADLMAKLAQRPAVN